MGSNFTNGDPSNAGYRLRFGSFTVPQDADASLTSSEGAIRHNKASLSVDSAFAAEGFGSPPAGLAALVADYVNRSTRDIPVNKLANMSPGSGNLGTAAAAGVNVVLGSLTPVQRDVMKAGGNPFSTADMQHFAAKLGITGYGLAAKGESALAGSGGLSRRGASSDAYAREIGGNAGYNALLKEGYRAAELNAVMPYARDLGWTDRNSLRMLADTGPKGGEVAKEFEAARKRNDKEGMARARQKAEENGEHATTDKEKRGWKGVIQKFDKLDKPSADNKIQSNASRSNVSAETANDQKALMEALRKRRAAAPPTAK
jgi:hypothetical protein